MTKSFSNNRVHGQHGHGWYDRTAPSITQLSVEVEELHAGENGRLELTCMATIPAFISHNGKYADIRQQTVISKYTLVTLLEQPWTVHTVCVTYYISTKRLRSLSNLYAIIIDKSIVSFEINIWKRIKDRTSVYLVRVTVYSFYRFPTLNKVFHSSLFYHSLFSSPLFSIVSSTSSRQDLLDFPLFHFHIGLQSVTLFIRLYVPALLMYT